MFTKEVFASDDGCSAPPVFAVEGAVTDGFGDVVGVDPIRAVEVGNRARDAQNTVMPAGAEPEFLVGGAEDLHRLVGQHALPTQNRHRS